MVRAAAFIAAMLWAAAAGAGPVCGGEWTLARDAGLVTARFPAGSVRVKVIDLRLRPPDLAAAYEAVAAHQCRGALAVVNGGFFGPDHSGAMVPVGLVVADGVRTSAAYTWKSGGVLVADPGLRIIPAAEFDRKARFDQAMQCKPMVVRNGVNDMPEGETKRSMRTVIGLEKDGSLVVAITETAGSLRDVGDKLITLSQGRLADALAMGGGPSAHLYLPGSGQHFGWPMVDYDLPNVICVMPGC